MKKKNETESLNETIILLRNKQSEELKLVKEQFHIIYESLKPINLIKDTVHEITSSPDLKNNLVNNIIGLTTGFLSKKILVGATHNPIKKLFGTLLQFTVANIVSKHSEGIKSVGENIVERILKFRKESKHGFNAN